MPLSLFPFLFFVSLLTPTTSSTSLYLSPTTFPHNYNSMHKTFKIYAYTPENPISYESPQLSLFHSSLLASPFLTQSPNEAHLFFVPLPSPTSTRSISRVIRSLRTELPFWNRTLGADHFFLSSEGIGYVSDRNLVELKKNSVQVSCFPAPEGEFVPHKDVTLPPLNGNGSHALHPPALAGELKYLAYARHGATKEALVNRLMEEVEFLIESEPSDRTAYEERLAGSAFCLFSYDGGDFAGFSDAVRFGCVPVVITDRPIQDLPLIDVLTWQEMALFVGEREVVNGGLKRVLTSVSDDRRARMRESCVNASTHFVWNSTPQPSDAFHMVMYQLWMRRHCIRYERREWA